jgi:drug/metabolite transporter (DMT)-like permease
MDAHAPVPSPAARTAAPGTLTGTDALLVLMTLIWGVNYIVIKAALQVFSPLAFNAVRFTIAAVAIGAVARASGSPRPPGRMVLRLALLGVLGNTFYQLAYIEGMARTRAGTAALIMAAVPVLTAFASHASGQERLRSRDLAGLALSTAGLALVVGGGAIGLSGALAGNLLMLGAAVLWTVYTIAAKPLVDALGPRTTTAWTMGLGAIPLILICTPSVAAQPWSAVGAVAWAGVVFSSLGALVLAYLIWYRGVARLGATRTAFYSNFSPAVALLAAWPLLGEVPTAWQILGAAGIFGSLAVVRS